MNRSNRSLYLLLAVVLATGCDGVREHARRGSDATDTVNRSWPASAIREVQVFEIDGSVTVDAADTNEISLVANASGQLEIKKGTENDGLFQTNLDGDTLIIGRKEHRRRGFRFFFFDRSERRVDYHLRVPRAMALDLKTINGKIVTRGIAGETEAVTVNGTIDVETAGTAELSAKTVNGRVKAKFLDTFNGARFKTVNGGVEAILPQNASFNVNLSQVNGDFEAAFPLSIHSNPGSRRVSGDVNGGEHELKIVTVNGDIELLRLGDKL